MGIITSVIGVLLALFGLSVFYLYALFFSLYFYALSGVKERTIKERLPTIFYALFLIFLGMAADSFWASQIVDLIGVIIFYLSVRIIRKEWAKISFILIAYLTNAAIWYISGLVASLITYGISVVTEINMGLITWSDYGMSLCSGILTLIIGIPISIFAYKFIKKRKMKNDVSIEEQITDA